MLNDIFSTVLQGRFSKSLKRKVIQSRAQLISTQLSAQTSDPPPGVYEDLVQLVGYVFTLSGFGNTLISGCSAICSQKLPHSVHRVVWDILLRELLRGSAPHLVAAIDVDDENVLLILRHLAACKLAAWYVINPYGN